jgi:hypothetical protein
MQNKRGQGLSTNAIILIILGLVVLIALIYGFATGWSAFKTILNPTNVDNIVEDCQTTCGLNQKYSFCQAERTLRVNEEKLEVKTSCAVLSASQNFQKYGVQTCPAISCDLTCNQIIIDGKTGQLDTQSGRYNVTGLVKEGTCFIN